MAQMTKATNQSVEIHASDWNNRIRDAAITISKKTPVVGDVVSILVGFFWPEDKVDVFQALKADMVNLVKKEILAYELNFHHSQINGLKSTIESYKAAQTHEKRHWLNAWINDANKLSIIFRESKNNIHIISLTVTLALLHLSGLRERLKFGKLIYEEDNTKQWKKELEDMYKTYIVDFLPTIFREWKKWREDQIEIKAWVSIHGAAFVANATVKDNVTGETKRFHKNDYNSTTHFKSICEDHKTRMKNDAFADMAGCISTTFVYDELLPDKSRNFPKYDKNEFGRVFRGPYAQDLFYSEYSYDNHNTRPDHDDYSPNSGPITKVIIREWNTIDAMQFIYANRQGQLAGNPNGGARHDVDVTGKPIYGLRMGFSNNLLTYVQINYCDGAKSETYGNRSGWRCYEASANGPSAYRLSSWSFKLNRGPSNTHGPGAIQLEYAPQMDDH